ncbi:MotA/TolQ/ExbB proton channel family protein [Porphyromonas sp.]
MDQISKVLFVISNSLLIPDILFLILLFIRSLILVGGFYNSFMQRRRMTALLGDVRSLNAENLSELASRMPKSNRSPFIDHLDELLTREGLTKDYANYLISSYENVCEKDLSLSKLLTKVGPALGLVGTLIAMSPALVGLSSGDIGAMAYNMQVVFATTVVGLVISLAGLVTLQYKQRWYTKDVALLDYISSLLLARQSK